MHTLSKLKYITFLLAGVVAAMIFFPAEALAATIPGPGKNGVWEVYGVGNAAMLRQAFIGIELMVNSKAYMSAVSVFALLGFVAVMFQFLTDPIFGFRKFIRYLILLIFMSAAFTIKADVTIKDFITPNSAVVTGVPAILVVPASIFSTMGQYIARMFTQYLAPVKAQHYPEANERSAFGLGAQMVIDATEMRFSDQDFTNNVSRYIVDCVSPLLYRQLLDPEDVRNSSDLWTLFSENTTRHAEGMLTKYYDKKAHTSGGNGGSGTAGSNMKTMLCKEVAAKLQEDLDANYAGGMWRGFLDRKMGTRKSAGSIETGVQNERVEDYFNDFLRYSFSGPGPEFNDYFIRQAAMVNLINYQMPNQMAQLTGSGVIAMKVANNSDSRGMEIQQTGAARTSFAISGYFFSILQILIIALGPVVLLALFIPGAGSKIFSSYMLMLAWFPACLVTMAVCNSLMLYWFSDMIVSMTDVDGHITLANRFAMTGQTAKFMAISSTLGTLAPMLAFGLLTGSTMVLSRIIGQMSHSAGEGQQALMTGKLGRTKGDKGHSMMEHANGKIGFGAMGLPNRRLGGSGIQDRQAMRTLDGMGDPGSSGGSGGGSDRIGRTISGGYGSWQKGMDREAESMMRNKAVSQIGDRNARAAHEEKINATGGPLSQIKEMGRREAANNQHVQAAMVTANQAKIDRGEGPLTAAERQGVMQTAAGNLPYANPRHLDGNQGLTHHVPRFGEAGASATQGAERNFDTGSVLNADGSHSSASAVGETKGYRSVPLNQEQIAARGNFNRYNELVEKGNNATREERAELQRMVDGGFVQNYQDPTTLQAPAAAAPAAAGAGVGGAAVAAAVGAGVGAAAGAAAAAPAPMGMAPTYADGNWRAQADAIRDANNAPLITARAEAIDPNNVGHHSPAVMQQATHDVAHTHGVSAAVAADTGQAIGESGLRGSPGLAVIREQEPNNTQAAVDNIMHNQSYSDETKESLIQGRMDEIRGFEQGLSETDLREQAEKDLNQASTLPNDITAIYHQAEETQAQAQAQADAAINSKLGITPDAESTRFEKLDPNAPEGRGLPENHTGHDSIRARDNADVLGNLKGPGIATAAAVSTLSASNSFQNNAAAVGHILNDPSHFDIAGVQVPNANGVGIHAATAADVAQWKDDLQTVQAHDRGESPAGYSEAAERLAAVAGPLQEHISDLAEGHHMAMMSSDGNITSEYKAHVLPEDEKLLRMADAAIKAHAAGNTLSAGQLDTLAKVDDLHHRFNYQNADEQLQLARDAGVITKEEFNQEHKALQTGINTLKHGQSLTPEQTAATTHAVAAADAAVARVDAQATTLLNTYQDAPGNIFVSPADQAVLQRFIGGDGNDDPNAREMLVGVMAHKAHNEDILKHAAQTQFALQEALNLPNSVGPDHYQHLENIHAARQAAVEAGFSPQAMRDLDKAVINASANFDPTGEQKAMAEQSVQAALAQKNLPPEVRRDLLNDQKMLQAATSLNADNYVTMREHFDGPAGAHDWQASIYQDVKADRDIANLFADNGTGIDTLPVSEESRELFYKTYNEMGENGQIQPNYKQWAELKPEVAIADLNRALINDVTGLHTVMDSFPDRYKSQYDDLDTAVVEHQMTFDAFQTGLDDAADPYAAESMDALEEVRDIVYLDLRGSINNEVNALWNGYNDLSSQDPHKLGWSQDDVAWLGGITNMVQNNVPLTPDMAAQCVAGLEHLRGTFPSDYDLDAPPAAGAGAGGAAAGAGAGAGPAAAGGYNLAWVGGAQEANAMMAPLQEANETLVDCADNMADPEEPGFAGYIAKEHGELLQAKEDYEKLLRLPAPGAAHKDNRAIQIAKAGKALEAKQNACTQKIENYWNAV